MDAIDICNSQISDNLVISWQKSGVNHIAKDISLTTKSRNNSLSDHLKLLNSYHARTLDKKNFTYNRCCPMSSCDIARKEIHVETTII